MSELKAIESATAVIEKVYLVYRKSEADKVIAYLKNEIEEQKRLRDMALASVPNVLKVMKIIQHHKYKRCLAMARWCDDAARLSTWDSDYHRCGWYNKWMQRWLKIAEQFKELNDEM